MDPPRDPRRLTIFPGTEQDSIRIIHEDSTPAIEAPKPKFYSGNGQLDVEPLRLPATSQAMHGQASISNLREDSTPAIEAPKPKFFSGNEPLEVELLRLPPTNRAMHKTFTPIDGDPGRHYRCIHIVDPEGERPYCLAQELASNATAHAYRIVMIRRSPDKSVVGLDNPNPNLLNVVSVFRFQGSIFTVFDRPGLPLSEVAVSDSPQLGLAEVRTISTQALSGICALSAAGLYLSSVNVKDITISACDGQVKVGFDRASLPSSNTNGNSSAFGIMLKNLISYVPSPLVLQQSDGLLAFIDHTSQRTYLELQKESFLKDSLPAPSLIPFVLNAQVIVFPLEHATETQITELKISSD